MFGIGSMHAWPALLAVLHWLVELIMATNAVDIENILFPPALVEDLNVSEKTFFDHSSSTYFKFVNGQDSFEEENKLLEVGAMLQAGCSERDSDNLEFKVLELEEELAMLEGEPDYLAEALKQKADLQDLIDQAEQSINELDQEHDFLQQQHTTFTRQLEEEGVNYALLGDTARQEELKRKSAEVENQVDQLTAEKEHLQQQNDEREVNFARVYNKFSLLANEYNDIAMKLSVNPLVKQYIGNESVILKFDHSQSNLNDFKLRLKPMLINLFHQVSDLRCKLQREKIKMEDQLDKLADILSSKENVELVQLQDTLARLEKELKSEIEFSEKAYVSAMKKLREREDLVDKKQKEATDALEEGKRQLAMVKKECDQRHANEVQQENTYVEHLLKYSDKVIEHKKFVEEQIDTLNNYVQSEIQNIAEERSNIKKLL